MQVLVADRHSFDRTVPIAAAVTRAGIPVVTTPAPLSLEDEAVVQRFQSFLRIPTVANEGQSTHNTADA